MISYITEVSLCWLAFYALYSLFLRGETFFHANRIYLLITLVLGLIIPLLEMPVGHLASGGVASYYIEPITVGVKSLEYSIEEIVVTPVTDTSSFSLQSILGSVYWIGLVFFLGRFLLGLTRIARLYISGKRKKEAGYTLIHTEGYHIPFSFFNCLFWSTSFEAAVKDEEKILLHELSHIRGGHSFDVVLLELLKIFLWCTPLIYLYKKELQTVHEYLADSEVLQTTAKKQYGQLLIRHAQSGLQLALANHFIHSQLKKRIQMMTKHKSSRRALTKYLLVFPLLILMILLFSNNQVIAKLQDTALHDGPGQDEVLSLIESDAPAAQPEKVTPADSSITDVFKVVEEMPRFPGCEEETDAESRKQCSMKKMIAFVSQNLKYPASARKAGTEGTVVVRFVVDKEGRIVEPKVIRDIGKGCGAEAQRVVEAMPDWIPGRQKGKRVNVEFNLPFKFKLNAKDKDQPAKAATDTPEKARDLIELPEDIPMVIVDGVITPIDIEQLDPSNIEKISVFKGEKAIELYGEKAKDGVIVVTTLRKSKEKTKTKIKSKTKQAPQPKEMARFPGCEEIEDRTERFQCSQKKLMTFVFSNIKYPKAAYDGGIEGTVVVKFLVDKTGNITERKVIRPVGSGCDEEVLRVIDLMSATETNWIPAMDANDQPVNSYITLPVKFKIPEKDKKITAKNELAVEGFKAYPNPGEGLITIGFKAPAGKTLLKVTDIDGKTVYSESLNDFDGQYSKQLDLSSAGKGNLILSIIQGERVFSSQIVIE